MWSAFTVPVEGATLFGEQRGDDAPLVLVHGMASSRAGWETLLAHLPEGLPVLRHDLRGFGQSEAAEGVAFSHADDLLALFDARGIDRAALVGLSMGGGIALNFALSHPEHVSHLVLISPAMVGWDWSDEWKARWREVASAARSGDMALARERWLRHPMFAALREGPMASALREEIEAYRGMQWLRTDERRELPDLDRLHTLAVPALLLTGGRDVPDMRLIADMIEGAAPDVIRIDFPQAGHMLPLEVPAEVAGAIVDFLES